MSVFNFTLVPYLTRLGSLRKDDYAFFLKPVDPTLVPGYGDLVKQPMDLGTMTIKVARGKYKTLEDFAVRTLHDSRANSY